MKRGVALALTALALVSTACLGDRPVVDPSAYGSRRPLTEEEIAQVAPPSSPANAAQGENPTDASTTYFVPFGSFSTTDLKRLQTFAKGLEVPVKILPAAPLSNSLFDTGQVVGERMIDALVKRYPSRAASSTLIGFTSADMRLDSHPEWAWAFGLRHDNLGVIATKRMTLGTKAGSSLYQARLRKMTGRYLGLLSLALPFSADPQSMLYTDVLGVDDLDRMRERF